MNASLMNPVNGPALLPHLHEARSLARLGRRVVVLGVLPVLAWLAFAPQ